MAEERCSAYVMWSKMSIRRLRLRSYAEKLRAEMGPVVRDESVARMYITLFDLPVGARNSSLAVAVRPVPFGRTFRTVGRQFDA